MQDFLKDIETKKKKRKEKGKDHFLMGFLEVGIHEPKS